MDKNQPSEFPINIPYNIWVKYKDLDFFKLTPEDLHVYINPEAIIDPLRKKVRKEFRESRLKSLLLFPYKIEDQYEGFIVFSLTEENKKEWNQIDIYIGLELIKVLSVMISKLRSEKALKSTQ
ncbi:unnamed protein product [marine sediment metagenome]|uniref:Uncharacterized protein n=1 Tax=marine sediment metagenome TaxID=412755 RepID=X1ABV6_9ZZZZ